MEELICPTHLTRNLWVASRHVLRVHRSMTETHMKRSAEWFLTIHEIR